MSLVNSNEILLPAQKGHYAVGAFNVENMEMVQAVIAAGVELRAPLIIQTTPSTLKYATPEMFSAMVQAEAGRAPIPVALHLDHGSSYELCCQTIHAGYTSVMIDGSKLPFEENVALAQKVVETASCLQIPVEAELGAIGGKEDSHEVKDKDALYTNPQQAREFAERTGISSLAVAIGTAHGFYKGIPKLDFERQKEILKLVSIPMVLHGASGVPDDAVRESIRLGICKVNFATELRAHYTTGCRTVLEDQTVFDPKKYGCAGREAVKQFVMERIRVCGSDGKAA